MSALMRNPRDRIAMAIAVVLLALCLLGVGGYFAFSAAVQEAAERQRIESLPLVDATAFAVLEAGKEIIITGKLDGNEALTSDGFVAYTQEQWQIKSAVRRSGSTRTTTVSGKWEVTGQGVPALTILIENGAVQTAERPFVVTAGQRVRFGGDLRKVLIPGEGALSASYEGELLPDGTLRTRGFFDGDPITVVGQKGSEGTLVPEWLFAGDRAQLADSIRKGEETLTKVGFGMMIAAPVVLGLGALLGVFRGKGKQAGT